jgi:hypothetical protein
VTPSKLHRRWLAILVLSFVAGLGVSWQRWTNPVIDSGREMNQPLRILDGERLYADVSHIYGPLSPYLHSALYRLFGPSLTVLYADGIVCAAIILVLVYLLARRILDPDATAIALLTVMWLCAFKPAGNYVFPYAFNALHGTLLALATLAIAAAALEAPSLSRFAWGGVIAGATVLAKIEMGIAALSAGLIAAWLSRGGETGAALRRAAVFCVCALAVAAAGYGPIAATVGWRTLAFDNWLLPVHLPAGLVYFNAGLSGFDHPLTSLGRMVLAAVKLVLMAAIVGAAAYLAAGPQPAVRRARLVLIAAVAVALALGLTTGLDWDRGPFMAMPLLLVTLVVWLACTPPALSGRTAMLYALFALVQLARILLHVRSGGAYGSFLLPMSIVMFVYLWTGPLAAALPDAAPRRAARAIVLSLLLASAVGTAIVLAYRYRHTDTVAIRSPRGTLIASADVGTAWNDALAFIAQRTVPGDYVAVLPEGTSLLFLAGRRNPLRDEIVLPGLLDAAGEARAIAALERTDTRLVLLVNRATREFGAEAFGRDYCQTLMTWIAARYQPCAMFGAQDPGLRIGDKPFFVRAYCR